MAQQIDFNNIRSLGSSNDGIEELVCQLAHKLIVPNGKHFVRNGRHDGRVGPGDEVLVQSFTF